MLARPDWKTMSRDEKVNALRLLVTEDMSASEIADRFDGVTRNGIIGFCRRWSISLPNSQPPSTKAKTPAKQKPRPRPSPPKPIGNTASKPLPPKLPEPDPATAVLFKEALDRHLCKWPLWDDFGPEAKCCGAQRARTGPYCSYHANRSVGAGSYGERDAIRQLKRAML